MNYLNRAFDTACSVFIYGLEMLGRAVLVFVALLAVSATFRLINLVASLQ